MEVVASAPGKVLLTGGYLILERPNAGIVLSTNARFYAIVKPIYEDFKPESWAWAWTDVKLTSPQLSRESMYKLSLKHLTLQCVSSSESRNPFVENAIQYAVAAAHAVLDKNKKDALDKLLLQGLEITILGCNDFYSYRNQIEARGLPLTPEALAALPPFTSITFNAGESNGGNCKPEVAKTGLGSSAAMTTAAVAALLHYLGVVNLSAFSEDPHQQNKDSMDLDVVHMIAQSAHCVAQGKVGSGFDVSSAVYGSQRYVRFSPKVLSAAQWMEGVAEPVKDELVKVLLKAREAMLGIRNHIRQMGQAAGIPIEPESQTELLDATMNMEGVLLAGVPGAGGFDAIFAVALGDSSSNVANAWSSRNVLALLVREDPQGVSLESGDPRSWEITSAVSSIHIK
ncbi:phosphomevalonate kinase, peroxisomal-like isoform X3 [Durio zibethinus]|uniref:phosphomevalonate kinase n=1 Tax=Durio zibethinus TaxID=66656 RepID=A0A6P5Y7H0_DURZI|nr:phosphomevalonate kinase, peroxisomal-like isoform X3 [Durio zibethinus]